MNRLLSGLAGVGHSFESAASTSWQQQRFHADFGTLYDILMSACLLQVQVTVEPKSVPVLERVGNGAVFGLTAFFAGTFLVSLLTYVHKYNKPEAKARRKVGHSGTIHLQPDVAMCCMCRLCPTSLCYDPAESAYL
jgi:hypothetical protein